MQDVPKLLICAVVGLVIGAVVFMIAWDWIVKLERSNVVMFGAAVGALIGFLLCFLMDRR